MIDAGANTVVDGVNLAEPPCVVHLPCMSVCSAHPLSVVCVYACVVLRSGRTTRWLRRCSMLRRWSLRLRIAPPHRAPETERHPATAGLHAKAGIPVCSGVSKWSTCRGAGPAHSKPGSEGNCCVRRATAGGGWKGEPGRLNTLWFESLVRQLPAAPCSLQRRPGQSPVRRPEGTAVRIAAFLVELGFSATPPACRYARPSLPSSSSEGACLWSSNRRASASTCCSVRGSGTTRTRSALPCTTRWADRPTVWRPPPLEKTPGRPRQQALAQRRTTVPTPALEAPPPARHPAEGRPTSAPLRKGTGRLTPTGRRRCSGRRRGFGAGDGGLAPRGSRTRASPVRPHSAGSDECGSGCSGGGGFADYRRGIIM